MTAAGKIAVFVAGVLLAFSLYVHFITGYWGDQDWQLLASRKLLEGRHLYTDQFIVSPPLIHYLYALPAFIALHQPLLADYQALVLLMAAAIAFVMVLCMKLVAAHPGFAASPSRRAGFAVLLAFLLVFRMAPAFFADRDHIFVVFIFPYLLRWMPSLQGAPLSRRMRITIGVLAGIGFSIKPHCLLVFAGLQLICLVRRNRPAILTSPENLAIYGVGAVYLLVICLFTPAYLTTVVPMALLTYSAITASGSFSYMLLIILALTFAMFRPQHTSPYRQDIYYLLLVSLLMAGYALIGNGWAYTYQPAITLLLLVNGFVLWEFLYLMKRGGVQSGFFFAGSIFCSLNFAAEMGMLTLYFMVITHPFQAGEKSSDYYRPYMEVLAAAPAVHSFGAIGMNYGLWTRVERLSGVEWEAPFPSLWMIPKFIISGPDFAARHAWVLEYVAGKLAEDLNRRKPEVVFVDRSNIIYMIGLAAPFDWLGMLSHYSKDFSEAWQHYHYDRSIDTCDILPPAQAVVQGTHNASKLRAKADCRFAVYRRTQ